MILYGLLALIAAILLVRIKMKNDSMYMQVLALLFYTFFFLGIYYFARKAAFFLCGDFVSGRNRFIWICLLSGSVLYLPGIEKPANWRVFCMDCLKKVIHLFVFLLLSILGFCTQQIEGLHIPFLLAGVCIIAVLLIMTGVRYRFGQSERQLDFRDVLLLFLLAGVYYYFGYAICYISTGVENPPSYIFINIIILFTALLLILFITANLNITAAIGAVANPIWILVHYFVYQFRGSVFVPNDIRAAATAFTVADKYQFYINKDIWRMCVFSLIIILVAANYKKVYVVKNRKFFSIAGTVILSVLIVCWYQSDFITWMNLPYRDYKQDQWYDSVGYTLGFIEVMKKNKIEKPNNYSEKAIEELASQYSGEELAVEAYPDIIVIMNEAFADIGDAGEIRTNIDYMPYYHSLATCKDTAVGRTLVSVLGGDTCQSEYEFLTGNSIEFAPNVMPYVTEMHGNMYSLVSTLKSQGYYARATHPYTATNWNRNIVYKYMQFDEMHFIEDYEDSEHVARKVSDRAIYQKIVKWLQEEQSESPQFIFAVTIQNHGGYNGEAIKEGEDLKVMRSGSTEPGGVDKYLSLIHESDGALEELIQSVDALERPTIVVMFGDHFPAMTDEFLDAIEGIRGKQNRFDMFQTQHSTPYIVHANYDVDLSGIPEYLSVNYLASNVLKACGLKMTAFQRYLLDMEKEIPAFNAFGFLDKDGIWYQYAEEYPQEYQKKLNEYNVLQYNARYKEALPRMFAVQ